MEETVTQGRALQRLLDELGRLPGIGPKSAQRIAYYILEADLEEAERLSHAILEVKMQVHFCPVCFSYATREKCDVCEDSRRYHLMEADDPCRCFPLHFVEASRIEDFCCGLLGENPDGGEGGWHEEKTL